MNKFSNLKNNAFTLAEIMLTLVILGTLITMTATRLLRQTPDVNKTRFKKAYVVTEQTVQKLVRNEVLYPGRNILRNTEPVTTTAGDQFGVRDERAKFREAFKYYVSIVDENIECDVFTSGRSNECFMTNDGVVYGIPDTNFDDTGVVRFRMEGLLTAEGEQPMESYVPITVYTSWNTKNNVATDAFVIGVRYDGKIKILNNEGCASPQDLRCKAEEFLESDDIKANSN